MAKRHGARSSRRKLTAHDSGNDRHSKSVSLLAKRERLAAEKAAQRVIKSLKKRKDRKGKVRSVSDVTRERLGLDSGEWV